MATEQSFAPLLAVRGSAGLNLQSGYKCQDFSPFQRDESAQCKCLTFTTDGSLLAWISESQIKVVKLPQGELIHQFPAGYSNSLTFSPKNSFLAAWGPYRISDKAPQGTHNLVIWNLKTGEKASGYIHKRHTDWKPLWSIDEQICTRVVADGILVLKGTDLGGDYITKFSQDNIQEFSVSPSTNPIRFALFNPTKKGAPAFVKMYNYPNFDRPVCQKSFYKADNVSMSWNKSGKSLLLHASTETDKTGSSYYGEQSLYFLSDEGDSIHVALAKSGPIYSVEWSPNGREFCVVYGSMPARATLYNLKCDPIHDFGSSYRNLIYFNPQGTILCLAGFGNLKGEMEFWSRKDLKLITKFQASDSTYFEWSPDGQYFVTATTAPRLRQGNGYKIWHYSGCSLHETKITKPKEELWEVRWRPVSCDQFPPFEISRKPIEGSTVTSKPQAKPAVYRPPGARGAPSKIKLHDDQEFTISPDAKDDKAMSKSALKNKKKRDAKARTKQDTSNNETASNQNVTKPSSTTVKPSSTALQPENEKKLKNLQRKLRQIETLKEQQNEGKKLEANQLEKLKLEPELRREIEMLKLS